VRTGWGRGDHWTIAAGVAVLAAVVVAALLALPSTGTPPAPLNTVAQTLACLEHVGDQPITASAAALYARGATDAPTPRAVYVLRDATILAVFAGTA
jgi:hypothetical protein